MERVGRGGVRGPAHRAEHASGGWTRHDDGVKAIYPDDGDGDRTADPAAVPGLRPGPEDSADDTSRTLEVDGETFAVRRNGFGGTDYTWLSGPNPGYGFGVSPTPDLSTDEHVRNIRGFLGMVDPGTGHIADG
ncbi:hypothetical protein [Micromonospora sp. WMMD708]|uniref:hypothetical protein n=1 Tax=Micromonospora sp. WMMD708 TaxID=3403464 RepID=UPI003BF4CCD7